jgi:hypothetical protein
LERARRVSWVSVKLCSGAGCAPPTPERSAEIKLKGAVRLGWDCSPLAGVLALTNPTRKGGLMQGPVRPVVRADIARGGVMIAMIASLVWLAVLPAPGWLAPLLPGVERHMATISGSVKVLRVNGQLTCTPMSFQDEVVANIPFAGAVTTYGGGLSGGSVWVGRLDLGSYSVAEKDAEELSRFLAEGLSIPAPFGRQNMLLLRPGMPARDVLSDTSVLRLVTGSPLSLLGVCAVLLLVLWLLRPRTPRALRRMRAGLCWNCGYPSPVVATACPECGAGAGKKKERT